MNSNTTDRSLHNDSRNFRYIPLPGGENKNVPHSKLPPPSPSKRQPAQRRKIFPTMKVRKPKQQQQSKSTSSVSSSQSLPFQKGFHGVVTTPTASLSLQDSSRSRSSSISSDSSSSPYSSTSPSLSTGIPPTVVQQWKNQYQNKQHHILNAGPKKVATLRVPVPPSIPQTFHDNGIRSYQLQERSNVKPSSNSSSYAENNAKVGRNNNGHDQIMTKDLVIETNASDSTVTQSQTTTKMVTTQSQKTSNGNNKEAFIAEKKKIQDPFISKTIENQTSQISKSNIGVINNTTNEDINSNNKTEVPGKIISSKSLTTNQTESLTSNNNNTTNSNNNSIKKTYNNLEKRLFHALHQNNIRNPSIKEFKECWAFANAVKSYYYSSKNKNNDHHNIDLILDVAGGHGALGALLLTSIPSTRKCVVIDPAENVKGGVELAWCQFYNNDGSSSKKELIYRHECLRTGLRQEISNALQDKSSSSSLSSPQRILVVACHACQHLTDETLEIACSFGVHVTVMPCCQKDLTGGSMKAFAKQAQMNIGMLMDILAAGKVMSWNNGKGIGVKYQVKLKLIDESITPQNRMIMCKAKVCDGEEDLEQRKIQDAHDRLMRAYNKAHSNAKKKIVSLHDILKTSVCLKSLSVGILAGVVISLAMRRRK